MPRAPACGGIHLQPAHREEKGVIEQPRPGPLHRDAALQQHVDQQIAQPGAGPRRPGVDAGDVAPEAEAREASPSPSAGLDEARHALGEESCDGLQHLLAEQLDERAGRLFPPQES